MTEHFDGVLKFAEHLVKLEIGLHAIEHRALDHVLDLLAKDMAEQIGTYQDEVGNFPAWAPLAESTEEEKARLGYPTNAPLLREGELKESFRHDIEGGEGVAGSTDPVMVYHEFGTVHMPPRPVVGPAVDRNWPKIEKILGRALVEVLVGGKIAQLPHYFEKIE